MLNTSLFHTKMYSAVKTLLLYVVNLVYPNIIGAKYEEFNEIQCEDDKYLIFYRKTDTFLFFIMQKHFNNCFTNCGKDLSVLPLKSKKVIMFHPKCYEIKYCMPPTFNKICFMFLFLGQEYALLFLARVSCTPWAVWQMQTWTVGN